MIGQTKYKLGIINTLFILTSPTDFLDDIKEIGNLNSFKILLVVDLIPSIDSSEARQLGNSHRPASRPLSGLRVTRKFPFCSITRTLTFSCRALFFSTLQGNAVTWGLQW